MQELGKFNFNKCQTKWIRKINFNINNKLAFINSFQFLYSSLGSLFKTLGKDGFKYLSQEFDSKVLKLRIVF